VWRGVLGGLVWGGVGDGCWKGGGGGGERCEASFDGVFCDCVHITIRRIRNVEVVSGPCETSLLR